MAAHERSAGIVICREQGQRLYLLLDYGHHWDYPKGHIETGETPLAAALRELEEETGITDAAVSPTFSRQINYYFREKKRKALVRKTVTFFLARINAEEITLSDEHEGYAFLPYNEALKRLTFASARQVLRHAEAFLRQ